MSDDPRAHEGEQPGPESGEQPAPTFFGMPLSENRCDRPGGWASDYAPLRVNVEIPRGDDGVFVAEVNPGRPAMLSRHGETMAQAVRKAERATVRMLDEMAEQAGYRLVRER